jgi:hypothetical protein
MVNKALLAALMATSVTMPCSEGHAWNDHPPSPDRHLKRYVGHFSGLRSHYASALQTGVYDSCWRRRLIDTEWGPELLSKWICHNYTTYGSHFDWGYGRAAADRFNGDPWR